MSDTPRTDAYYEKWQESWSREPINLDLCRQLERELAEMRQQRDTLAEALHDVKQTSSSSRLRRVASESLAAVKGGSNE
jgi:hypothetical protein